MSTCSSDGALVRVVICGAVDHGKSTLVGRMLAEAGSVTEDEIARVERLSRSVDQTPDYSLLLDGLEAEREQGITIDVAWRRFSTKNRIFLLADVPGHEQYTRNMATGAALAEVLVLVVDARQGLTVQSRRHAQIAALFGIRTVILAVAKMDLVDYSAAVFAKAETDFRAFAERLKFEQIVAVPVSASFGVNVTKPAAETPWYRGPALLDALNGMQPAAARTFGFRLPVQIVLRASESRFYAGTVAAGAIDVGEPVVVARSGEQSRVKRIFRGEEAVTRLAAGESGAVELADHRDLARGDVLIAPSAPLDLGQRFAAHIVWFAPTPLLPERSYLLKSLGTTTTMVVTSIRHRLDPELGTSVSARSIEINEIGSCHVATDGPVAFDRYQDCRDTGSFVIVDRHSKSTVGAGLFDYFLRRDPVLRPERFVVDRPARARHKQQRPCVIWFTGLPAAGKSTLANALERRMYAAGLHTYILDGDNIRGGLNKDLGFTEADRVENIRRAAEVAALMMDAGLIVLCCFVSPFRGDRESARERIGRDSFVEVHVSTPLAVCVARDPKALYARARSGDAKNVTGIDQPYEAPETPDLAVDASGAEPDALAARLFEQLEVRGFLRREVRD